MDWRLIGPVLARRRGGEAKEAARSGWAKCRFDEVRKPTDELPSRRGGRNPAAPRDRRVTASDASQRHAHGVRAR